MGYVVDLTNPQYRAFAVKTIVDWMNQAPLGGILFDNADLLSGKTKDNRVNNLGMNWNQLLCAENAVLNEAGDCDRVTAWNQGMRDLFSEMKAALAPLGKEVIYNGISPAPLHGVDRNVSLLNQTDGATNEAFCYMGALRTFQSMLKERDIMVTHGAQNKKIFQIANYTDEVRQPYGAYCVAGFLIGWVPDKSYLVYHKNYDSIAPTPYPEVSEINLNLGLPLFEIDDW